MSIYYPCFFTATILDWQPLLKTDKYKELILSTLAHLVQRNRVDVYAFVIMINHLHIIWQVKTGQTKSDIQRDFLRFTAKEMLADLQIHHPDLLQRFKVNSADRQYQIWKRNPMSIELFSEKVLQQKLNYIHHNPVRAGIVSAPSEYMYSSAAYYEGRDSWPFLKHYAGFV